MSSIATTIDASPFFNLVNDLSEIAGDTKQWKDVLVDQVAALMKVCIRLTHAAKVGTIERHVAFRNRSISVRGGSKFYVRKDGSREWLIDSMSGFNAYDVQNWKVPGPVWAKALIFKKALEQNRLDPEIAKKARGFSKHTWYEIVNALGAGEKVGVPAYVKDVGKFRGGVPPQVGFAKELVETMAFYIEIRNESRLLTQGASKHFRGKRESLDGYKILQSAIAQRAAAFQRDLKNNVFDDVFERAKRYPGIFLS